MEEITILFIEMKTTLYWYAIIPVVVALIILFIRVLTLNEYAPYKQIKRRSIALLIMLFIIVVYAICGILFMHYDAPYYYIKADSLCPAEWLDKYQFSRQPAEDIIVLSP